MIPLVVDLDGTLILTDVLFESVVRLLRQKPWTLFLLPVWLLGGIAHLRRQVAQRAQIDLSLLPLNQKFLAWLRAENQSGRRLILATGCDRLQAVSLAEPLQLFETILGSDGHVNLTREAKRAAIEALLGSNFDYAGNSSDDLPVWKASSGAIVVNASASVEREANRLATVKAVFPGTPLALSEAVRALRCSQWIKNLLVFVPAVTSHKIFEISILAEAALAFLAFSLCASGIYIANDLLDLEDDRRHPVKRNRPMASGRFGVAPSLALALVSTVSGLALAGSASGPLGLLLLLYLASGMFYSLSWKRFPLADVFALALFYTLRIAAGNLITGIAFSTWLLSFGFFLFLSLAFSKRASELIAGNSSPARGYRPRDLPLVTTAGVCSGFLSSLVLALYVNSTEVRKLYVSPALLWGLLPPLLFYVTRLWLVCGRGELNEDPILYTVKTPSTWVAGLLIAALMAAATFIG